MSGSIVIGERIRAARKARGLSVPEAAGRIGILPESLRAMETGKRRVGGFARVAVASVLGLSIADLTPLDAATLDVAIGALVQIGGCDRAIVRLRELRVEASS